MLGKLKDTRIIACAIAVACMVVDDLPEPGYNTFHDPGAAAMLSLIFANAITLAGRRRWTWKILIAAGIGLFLKLLIQPLFWVHNAETLDLGVLLLAHLLLGFMAFKGNPRPLRFEMSSLALGGVIFAVIITLQISLSGPTWITNWVQLATARILVPIAFWTMVNIGENRLRRAKQAQ